MPGTMNCSDVAACPIGGKIEGIASQVLTNVLVTAPFGFDGVLSAVWPGATISNDGEVLSIAVPGEITIADLNAYIGGSGKATLTSGPQATTFKIQIAFTANGVDYPATVLDSFIASPDATAVDEKSEKLPFLKAFKAEGVRVGSSFGVGH